MPRLVAVVIHQPSNATPHCVRHWDAVECERCAAQREQNKRDRHRGMKWKVR